jgi:flagellar hook-length control protein FliK
MEWRLVALKIGSSSSSSSSSSATRSSSANSSSNQVFSIDHTKMSSSSGSTSAGSKPAGGSASSSSSKSGSSQAKIATSAASSKSKSSCSSTNDTTANSSEAAAADGSGANAAAAGNSQSSQTSTPSAVKGRLPVRGTATKTAAAQTANATAENASDVSNAGGLSILQLLARSLDGDDSAAATAGSADSADEAVPTKSADDADGSSSTDPNAAALQLLSQALAAALGGVTAPVRASPSGAAAAAASDESAEPIDDATKSANNSSLQDLVSLLAQNVAADSKGKSGTDVPQADATGSRSAPTGTGAGASAATTSNSIAHLGVASHFSLQHSQSDTSTTTGELQSQVGSAAWNDELGGQLTWMTHQGIESGSLKLSPEHLGPVEVTISVQNGDASVWFGANQADTRAALEQALPRLREMFASQGLTLTDSGVSRESPRNQSKQTSQQGVTSVAAIGGAATSGSAAVRMTLSLVDTYA